MLWCLMLGVAMAAPLEGQKQQTDLETAASSASSRLLLPTSEDPGMNASVQGTNTAIALLTAYAIFMFFDGNLKETEEAPNYAYNYYDSDGYSSYVEYARSITKALADNESEGVISTVLNSIDPVEMSFRIMEIDHTDCRKRTLCELSATPILGQFFRYISPNISSLKNYQDAMTAGEAKQDCAVLFAECPENQRPENQPIDRK